MTYCTDIDLLSWEPDLPREAAFASQTLLTATAGVAGTTLTLSGGASFSDARVRVGHVVVLSGAIEGCFPIVAIASDTVATISRLHEGLLDGSPSPTLAEVGDADTVTLAVRTFAPQRLVASEMISRLGGAEPEHGQTIVNVGALRRPAVLGTLQMIYSALAAAGGEDAADLIVRSELYERLYRRSLRSLHVEIDTNADGRADLRRLLRTARLLRG